jgi:hypothetical protein
LPPVNVVLCVAFDIRNPTKQDFSINKFDLYVVADNEPLATGTTAEGVLFPKGQTRNLQTKINVDPAKVTKNLLRKMKGGGIDYRVDGTFYFLLNKKTYPFQTVLKRGQM